MIFILLGVLSLSSIFGKVASPPSISPSDLIIKLPAFERSIRKFEEKDIVNTPPKDAVLFVGSSSIRGWKSLSSDFPFVKTINRGFGGSQFSHLIKYSDRMVTPYAPRLVIVYEGDNDLAAGKSPKRVLREARVLVHKLRMRQPLIRIAFLAIKASPARIKLLAKMKKTNRLLQAFCRQSPRLHFIDGATPLLNKNGKPDPEFYAKDGLHLNRKGYEKWRKAVTPYLTMLPSQNLFPVKADSLVPIHFDIQLLFPHPNLTNITLWLKLTSPNPQITNEISLSKIGKTFKGKAMLPPGAAVYYRVSKDKQMGFESYYNGLSRPSRFLRVIAGGKVSAEIQSFIY